MNQKDVNDSKREKERKERDGKERKDREMEIIFIKLYREIEISGIAIGEVISAMQN